MKSSAAFARTEPTSVVALERIVALEARIVMLEADLVAARRYMPITPPVGWKRVKQIAEMAHRSEAAIYKAVRLGRYESAVIHSQIWIDPGFNSPAQKVKTGRWLLTKLPRENVVMDSNLKNLGARLAAAVAHVAQAEGDLNEARKKAGMKPVSPSHANALVTLEMIGAALADPRIKDTWLRAILFPQIHLALPYGTQANRERIAKLPNCVRDFAWRKILGRFPSFVTYVTRTERA
jgi:hypothetical protein